MAIAQVVAGLVLGSGRGGAAQELEPGAYLVAPVGVNVVVISNTLSRGDLSFDPSGPIDEARGTINVTTVGYGRALSLAGRSAQIAIAVPMVAGHLEGTYLGELAEVSRVGLGDVRLRIAVNLFGAPALGRTAFAASRASRLFGASLSVSTPTGPYTSDRLINIGNARWAFKPEIALVQRFARWTIETFGGVWMFTKNDEFYRGSVRTQQPIGSTQLHVQYAISPRLSLSANGNFYFGGRTTVNGRRGLDLQRNSRVGLTMVRPFAGGRTLRLAVSQGAYTTIGADFTSVSVAFQRAWGGEP